LRKLEVEAANLRLIKTMADRMAHEIGNTMVPLSTHQQLLTEKYKDAEFRQSLDHALADGVKRVTRLINQMRFLAREGQLEPQAFPVEKLIQEAYQEANPSSSLATVPRLSMRSPKSCSTHFKPIRRSRQLVCICPLLQTKMGGRICRLKSRTTVLVSLLKQHRKCRPRFSPRVTSVWDLA
jgi:signal transduction histidine kinase